MKIFYIAPKKEYQGALAELILIRDKRVVKCFTTAMTLLIACTNCMAKGSNPVEELGYTAIDWFQLGLTILAIIMALFEVGKALLEGDPKRIPGLVAKYVIAVVFVYGIPTVFFKIRDAFSDWRL